MEIKLVHLKENQKACYWVESWEYCLDDLKAFELDDWRALHWD